MKLFVIMIMLTISSSSYAVDVACLKRVNGRCVSVNDIMFGSTVNALAKVPETAEAMLFGTGKNQGQSVPLKGNRDLHECMKGKKVIDNDVINCRNGL